MKAEIKLSSQDVKNLVQWGFAPEFASLAAIMGRAVTIGTKQLYDALATPDLSVAAANILYGIAAGAKLKVSSEALMEMVSEENSLDPFPSALQKAAKLGARTMYEGLDASDKERADRIFGDAFKPQIGPWHVEGPKGELDFDDVVEILNSRRLTAFNLTPNPRVEVEGVHIVVSFAGDPMYYFNEQSAVKAVFDGKRLSMPDTQGFPALFQFL